MLPGLHLPWHHPIADKFPMMDRADLDKLTEDIRKNGQRQPVCLYQGHVWDGRARIEACRRVGVQPKYWLFRRGDPITYLIGRHNRYGAPSTPERQEALALFSELEGPEWRAKIKKERSDWMTEARREFRRLIAKSPRPCDACGKHIEFVQAHHVLPLNIQFDLGVPLAEHDHDWLCPTHHRIVHVFHSIYLTGAQDGTILDNIRPERDADWAASERVFDRGYKLFKKYGGQQYSWARWHEEHS
jgi:hypothetical protein